MGQQGFVKDGMYRFSFGQLCRVALQEMLTKQRVEFFEVVDAIFRPLRQNGDVTKSIGAEIDVLKQIVGGVGGLIDIQAGVVCDLPPNVCNDPTIFDKLVGDCISKVMIVVVIVLSFDKVARFTGNGEEREIALDALIYKRLRQFFEHTLQSLCKGDFVSKKLIVVEQNRPERFVDGA